MTRVTVRRPRQLFEELHVGPRAFDFSYFLRPQEEAPQIERLERVAVKWIRVFVPRGAHGPVRPFDMELSPDPYFVAWCGLATYVELADELLIWPDVRSPSFELAREHVADMVSFLKQPGL